MTPDEYQAAILDRLNAFFTLGVAVSVVVVLLLSFVAVLLIGKR